MSDLFEGDKPDFSTAALRQGCLREIAFRERVYPRLVAKGSMTQAQADYEIALMKELVVRLEKGLPY